MVSLCYILYTRMTKKSQILSANQRRISGQNVIEYLLVTAVFLLICLVFFHPSSGPAKTAMENILNQTVTDIDMLRGQIQF